MEPLTTATEVGNGLDFDLDGDLEKIAKTAIEDLSDDARFYGLSTWMTQATTPTQVQRLVRRAAIRYMKNYEGFVQSRAGDETLVWSDLGEDAGSPFFTDKEKQMLSSYQMGRATLTTAGVMAWNTVPCTRPVGLVPTGIDSKPFPLFASEDDPW